MTKPTTVARAAIYVRVSTDEQVGGTSLDTQLAVCRQYVSAKGWPPAHEFCDGGVSGALASRPQLDLLMAAARSRQIDAVVVSKLDRFGRSLRNIISLIGELDDLGVSFISVQEGLDATTATGRLHRSIMASFAEFERETIRERMTAGKLAHVRLGKWPGGPPPFGYRIEGSGREATLAIDERESTILLTAIELVVDRRMTTGEAASVLNDMGLPPRKSPSWNHGSLRAALSDARGIAGEWSYGRDGQQLTLEIPALVSRERLAQLHQRLAESATVRRPLRAKGQYLLSGRLFSECGARMYGMRQPRGLAVYRCSNSYPEVAERCDCPRVAAPIVEGGVWDEVAALLSQPDRLIALAQGVDLSAGTHAVASAADVAALDRKIARLERALGRGLADLLAKGVDPVAATHAQAQLSEELAVTRTRRATAAAWAAAAERSSERAERIWALAENASKRLANPTFEEKRRTLDLLGVEVRVVGSVICATCSGKGLVSAGHPPRTRRRGATGVVCPTCLRLRRLPQVAISGVVPEGPARVEEEPLSFRLVRREQATP